MAIKRNILKFRSGFYYYSLVLLGLTGVLFLTRCKNPESEKDKQKMNDLLLKAKQDSLKMDSLLAEQKKLNHIIDSLRKSDSLRKADSLRKDSILRAYKPVIHPKPIAKKYGVVPTPPKYGTKPN